jgi:hypothetical protein
MRSMVTIVSLSVIKTGSIAVQGGGVKTLRWMMSKADYPIRVQKFLHVTFAAILALKLSVRGMLREEVSENNDSWNMKVWAQEWSKMNCTPKPLRVRLPNLAKFPLTRGERG